MHEPDTPVELLFNGSGNSLAALLVLHHDRRFFDAAGRLRENQSEPELSKKGFPVVRREQKPIRRTRLS